MLFSLAQIVLSKLLLFTLDHGLELLLQVFVHSRHALKDEPVLGVVLRNGLLRRQ